jgi:cytochrome c oxidase subunit II
MFEFKFFTNLLSSLVVFSDAPIAWQFGLQDPATVEMLGMVELHNNLMNCLIMIGFFVLQFLCYTCETYGVHNNKLVNPITHSSILEIFWTLFPAGLLLHIALPSFSQIFKLDLHRLDETNITVKVIGHQWYWSYEVTGDLFRNGSSDTPLAFDSYMLKGAQLVQDDHLLLRLLETDNCLQLPTKSRVKLLITSSDVLHSWAVPSFGIKVDACPGRLSQATLFINRPGIFYGQCSELCGVNHGFMPIHVNVTDSVVFNLIAKTFFGESCSESEVAQAQTALNAKEIAANLTNEDLANLIKGSK